MTRILCSIRGDNVDVVIRFSPWHFYFFFGSLIPPTRWVDSLFITAADRRQCCYIFIFPNDSVAPRAHTGKWTERSAFAQFRLDFNVNKVFSANCWMRFIMHSHFIRHDIHSLRCSGRHEMVRIWNARHPQHVPIAHIHSLSSVSFPFASRCLVRKTLANISKVSFAVVAHFGCSWCALSARKLFGTNERTKHLFA